MVTICLYIDNISLTHFPDTYYHTQVFPESLLMSLAIIIGNIRKQEHELQSPDSQGVANKITCSRQRKRAPKDGGTPRVSGRWVSPGRVSFHLDRAGGQEKGEMSMFMGGRSSRNKV